MNMANIDRPSYFDEHSSESDSTSVEMATQ